jgi:hypothetical protein
MIRSKDERLGLRQMQQQQQDQEQGQKQNPLIREKQRQKLSCRACAVVSPKNS